MARPMPRLAAPLAAGFLAGAFLATGFFLTGPPFFKPCSICWRFLMTSIVPGFDGPEGADGAALVTGVVVFLVACWRRRSVPIRH